MIVGWYDTTGIIHRFTKLCVAIGSAMDSVDSCPADSYCQALSSIIDSYYLYYIW